MVQVTAQFYDVGALATSPPQSEETITASESAEQLHIKLACGLGLAFKKYIKQSSKTRHVHTVYYGFKAQRKIRLSWNPEAYQIPYKQPS